MGDITPSRIEPLGEAPENQGENSHRWPRVKPKDSEKAIPAPPPVESEKDESHQLDELA